MSAGAAPQIRVPRWIQLVALPLMVLAAWMLASAVRHALFVFMVSAVIAVLLNPLVHRMTQWRLPRGLAVLVVYLSFATVVVAASVVIGTLVVSQVQSVAGQVEQEFTEVGPNGQTGAQNKVDDLQSWLDDHGLSDIRVENAGREFVDSLRDVGVAGYTQRALDLTQTVATTVVEGAINVVLVLVISIYMLLDAPRISRFVNRILPPAPGETPLPLRVQSGVGAYVRGQAFVSLIIGASAFLAMELFGLFGIWPDAGKYAFFLGAWATVTEIIPYVGPILGAIPAVVLAFFDSPLTALWVALAYLAIHQLEGHVVVPRVMGSALGAHPLVIIFALLAAAELYGLGGVLLALPILAMAREVWLFVRPRIRLEQWEPAVIIGGGLGLDAPPPVPEEPPDEHALDVEPAGR